MASTHVPPESSPEPALHFVKMHGLGNDFVVVDARRQRFEPNAVRLRRLADRRTGIGFDQLLLIDRPLTDADVSWRIFNADGSEAEQCGNGARCVAALVAGDVPGPIRIEGIGGLLDARVRGNGLVSIDMGIPSFEPADLPFDPAAGDATFADGAYTMRAGTKTVSFRIVSMGNPHVVLTVDDVAESPVVSLGPLLERHRAFPQRTNVGFTQREAEDRIRLRVWERGSGETRACGTGACAAAAALRVAGMVAERVAITLPGGELTVEWPGAGERLWMTGPATRVYEGTIATT